MHLNPRFEFFLITTLRKIIHAENGVKVKVL